MRIKFGFVAGFVAGYYLGAMAGRERYQQMNRLIGKMRRSQVVDLASDKAKSAADTGYHRAKDKVGDKLHHNGSSEPAQFSPS